MTKLHHFVLHRIDEDDPVCQALYRVFAETLKPDMSFREFRNYYQNDALEYIDGSFIMNNNSVIGFYTAAFYHIVVNNNHYVAGRSAIGIIEAERSGRLPIWSLFGKFIRYKKKHPFYKLVMTGYLANPIVYAMLCKYVGIVYPVQGQTISGRILNFKDALLHQNRLKKGEVQPFILKIHFCVRLLSGDIERIMRSANKHIRYFLRINPRFREQYGLLVIIPVSWWNIFLSGLKYAGWKLFKHLRYVLRMIRLPAGL